MRLVLPLLLLLLLKVEVLVLVLPPQLLRLQQYRQVTNDLVPPSLCPSLPPSLRFNDGNKGRTIICQMNNTEVKDTPSHVVKYVDPNLFHLLCDRSSGGVVIGKNTKVKIVNILVCARCRAHTLCWKCTKRYTWQ